MKLLVMAPKGRSESTDMIITEAKTLFDEVAFVPLKKVIINASDGFGAFFQEKNLGEYNYLLPRIDSTWAIFIAI